MLKEKIGFPFNYLCGLALTGFYSLLSVFFSSILYMILHILYQHALHLTLIV